MRASVSYALPTYVENLVLIGTAAHAAEYRVGPGHGHDGHDHDHDRNRHRSHPMSVIKDTWRFLVQRKLWPAADAPERMTAQWVSRSNA